MGKDSERSPPSFFSQEEQKLLIQTFFDDKIQRMLEGLAATNRCMQG